MRFLRLLGFLLLLALAGGGFAGLPRSNSPTRASRARLSSNFPRGTGTSGIADALAQAGVVRRRWDFLLARARQPDRVLQAGEYRFDRAASPDRGVRPHRARRRLLLSNWWCPKAGTCSISRAAAEQLGLFPAAEFLEAARNPALIRDLDPQAPTLEGYLFPDTYKLGRHTTPERLCRIMTGKFREVWRGLHTNADVHRTVTLASLVEKEGKLADERPRIAAVFENRLRIGMKLDCDPTTIYAALLQDRYTRRDPPHRSGQRRTRTTPTATPACRPGPIANPGLASLRAALAPVGSRRAVLRGARRTARAGTNSRTISPRTKRGASDTAVPSAKVRSSSSSCATISPRTSPPAITEAVWQELLKRLAPVSESYLRDLLRATGLPFDQPYAGIRQHTFEELEHRCSRCCRSTAIAVAGDNASARATAAAR